MAELIEPQPRRLPALSLLAAAYTPAVAPLRTARLSYAAAPRGGYRLLDPCGSAIVTRGYLDAANTINSDPFVVQVQDTCSVMGTGGRDWEARARARLAETESAAIAYELWSGELATAAGSTHPKLTGTVTDLTPGGGAVSPQRGLGLIEQALGELFDGPPGMIHASRGTAVSLSDLFREGNLLITRLGTPVVADAGYPGTSPAGTAPTAGEGWLYATGPVTVHRGPVDVTPTAESSAVDRAVNTIAYTAERLAAVHFDGGPIGVRITLA